MATPVADAIPLTGTAGIDVLVLATACFAMGLLSVALAAAEPPRHGLPIDCLPGETCWIVNYVDRDAGAAARDYTCGPQTYNGHTGTDFAIRNLREMDRGMPVLATAPGVVRAVRDGMPDRRVSAAAPRDRSGRECGNGVVVDHGEGWETQYCHLRRGSVRVRAGERVERGTELGLVGMSGRTQFPHVHLSVRHEGRPIDPFVGAAAGSGCGRTGDPLWTSDAGAVLGYRPVSIYDAGVAGAPPTAEHVFSGEGISRARRASNALVVWSAIYGVRAGDEIALSLIDPGGQTLVEHRRRVERPQARRLEYAGRRRGEVLWTPGRYRAVVRVVRPQAEGGPLLVERILTLELD